jgi:hypothetical protein
MRIYHHSPPLYPGRDVRMHGRAYPGIRSIDRSSS